MVDREGDGDASAKRQALRWVALALGGLVLVGELIPFAVWDRRNFAEAALFVAIGIVPGAFIGFVIFGLRTAIARRASWTLLVGVTVVLAVLFASLSLYLWWGYLRAAKADKTSFLPLPSGMRILAHWEDGCNFAGPEPPYLVLVVVLEDSKAVSAENVANKFASHLQRRGFRLSPPSEYETWGSIVARGHDLAIEIGTADRFLQYAAQETISNESFAESEFGSKITPKTALARFDVTHDPLATDRAGYC